MAGSVFSEHSPLVHMAAASAGEVVSKGGGDVSILLIIFIELVWCLYLQMSCVVRVPFEVVKQRSQANVYGKGTGIPRILRHILQTEVFISHGHGFFQLSVRCVL